MCKIYTYIYYRYNIHIDIDANIEVYYMCIMWLPFCTAIQAGIAGQSNLFSTCMGEFPYLISLPKYIKIMIYTSVSWTWTGIEEAATILSRKQTKGLTNT